MARRRGQFHPARSGEEDNGRNLSQAGRTARSERYDRKNDRTHSGSERPLQEHLSGSLAAMVQAVRKGDARTNDLNWPTVLSAYRHRMLLVRNLNATTNCIA